MSKPETIICPSCGKPPDKCPDGPRYRAIGNGMAMPVLRWVGQRIQQVEDLLND
ncbi:hypothetical protein LCGC14_0817090 [marine sediment metagenome]|uniref:DNA (cytosine-5-)-methyltransferase n=1 Tax=marine sediment metagenome TaxID=412755 RepID=A0A0F9SSC1_9ZZZZ